MAFKRFPIPADINMPRVVEWVAQNLRDVDNELNIQRTRWEPELTFATPGDLSVEYHEQKGYQWRNQELMFVHCYLSATPTFTTSSGEMRITNLNKLALLGNAGFGALTVDSYPMSVFLVLGTGITITSLSDIFAVVRGGENWIVIGGQQFGSSAAFVTANNVDSGIPLEIMINGFYPYQVRE